MRPADIERASLTNDLVAIYIATQARRSLVGDRLAGVAAILLAGLCGVGPWVVFSLRLSLRSLLP